jgi:hypothetical protein
MTFRITGEEAILKAAARPVGAMAEPGLKTFRTSGQTQLV